MNYDSIPLLSLLSIIEPGTEVHIKYLENSDDAIMYEGRVSNYLYDRILDDGCEDTLVLDIYLHEDHLDIVVE